MREKVRERVKDVFFTSLEVQKEPAVTEVEVSVISVLLHQFKQLRVQDLKSRVTDRVSAFRTADTYTHAHTIRLIPHLNQ